MLPSGTSQRSSKSRGWFTVAFVGTVAIVYGVVFSMLGVISFALGYREMLRVGRRKKLNTG